MDPDELMASLERQLKPYRGEFPSGNYRRTAWPGPR